MPWMMDMFLRVEDEILVSLYRFEDKTDMFLFFVFSLYFKSCMGLVQMCYIQSIIWFNETLISYMFLKFFRLRINESILHV